MTMEKDGHDAALGVFVGRSESPGMSTRLSTVPSLARIPCIGKMAVRRTGDRWIGEPSWIRTSDLLIKSQLLYRLSYGPTGAAVSLVGACGQGARRDGGW